MTDRPVIRPALDVDAIVPALTSPMAEAAVLGAVLLDNAVLPTVRETLDAGMFGGAGHGAIFDAMCRVQDSGAAVDPVTVRTALIEDGTFEAAGGDAYLGELMDAVPTAVNVAYHAGIVRQKHDARAVVAALRTFERAVVQGQGAVQRVLAEARGYRDRGCVRTADALESWLRATDAGDGAGHA